MSKHALVINCGSSSIKFAVFNQAQEEIFSGLAERLGETEASISYRVAEQDKVKINLKSSKDHLEALNTLTQILNEHHLLDSLSGVGHRVVHGGEKFSKSMLITHENLTELETLNHLAPLHNPVNILGLKVCQEILPDTPQVAVFDTAFHQTIPQHAFLYAVPLQWYKDYGVRRYGFHGTSYRYIARAASELLNKPQDQLNLLVAHLGNGCSACAIKNGHSVDTTMGLTPLEGMVMGTRSGDIDPGLVEFMCNIEKTGVDTVMSQLNKKSGLLGLSESSNDMRTLLEEEANGSQQAKTAIDTFCFRAARQLSALSTGLSNIDAVVFTGGIGEHAALIRQRILEYWQSGHFALDENLNQKHGNELGRITQEKSPLAMVIATNEELMIAADTFELSND